MERFWRATKTERSAPLHFQCPRDPAGHLARRQSAQREGSSPESALANANICAIINTMQMELL